MRLCEISFASRLLHVCSVQFCLLPPNPLCSPSSALPHYIPPPDTLLEPQDLKVQASCQSSPCSRPVSPSAWMQKWLRGHRWPLSSHWWISWIQSLGHTWAVQDFRQSLVASFQLPSPSRIQGCRMWRFPPTQSLLHSKGSECFQTPALCRELFSLGWKSGHASCQREENRGEGMRRELLSLPGNRQKCEARCRAIWKGRNDSEYDCDESENVIEGVHLFSQAPRQGCRFCPEET